MLICSPAAAVASHRPPEHPSPLLFYYFPSQTPCRVLHQCHRCYFAYFHVFNSGNNAIKPHRETKERFSAHVFFSRRKLRIDRKCWRTSVISGRTQVFRVKCSSHLCTLLFFSCIIYRLGLFCTCAWEQACVRRYCGKNRTTAPIKRPFVFLWGLFLEKDRENNVSTSLITRIFS